MEYDKYQMDKMISAKNDFWSLLKETKVITYRSHDLIKESGRHFKDVIDVLKVHTIIYYATSEQQGGRGKQGQSKPHTSPCLESSLCSQTDQTFLIINVIE